MKRPKRTALLQLWLADHVPMMGLVLGLAALIFAYGVYLTPIGPHQLIESRIIRIGLAETDFGSYPTAVFEINGQNREIKIPRGSFCMVGSKLHLQLERRLWGVILRPDYPPCDAPVPP